MATQAERRATTRTAVVEAAYAAFELRGSLDVPLEQIARDAGVTKGSIHYHFDNRRGLLAEVAVWLFARFERKVSATATADGREIGANEYVRALLSEQAKPVGRVLFSIGDELLRTASLGEIDPYPYLRRRLRGLGACGPTLVTAGAILHFGRQLAFGLAGNRGHRRDDRSAGALVGLFEPLSSASHRGSGFPRCGR